MTAGRKIPAILVAAFLLSGQAADEGGLDDAFAQTVLTIEASEHACYRFDVYLALNTQQQRRGLMHVRNLPERTGMLFIYRNAAFLSMWMKNTYIPLDILFIRGDGTVSSVAADTVPLSLQSIRAVEPVNFVLELNAGVSKRLHIDSGSRLVLEQPEAGD